MTRAEFFLQSQCVHRLFKSCSSVVVVSSRNGWKKNKKVVNFVVYKLLSLDSMAHVFSFFYYIVCMYIHSSEIRLLCLMKWSRKTLQILPCFWSMKTWLLTHRIPKIWRVSVGHFIMHKPFNSEEWFCVWSFCMFFCFFCRQLAKVLTPQCGCC